MWAAKPIQSIATGAILTAAVTLFLSCPAVHAQDMLPSLDRGNDTPSGITPVSELTTPPVVEELAAPPIPQAAPELPEPSQAQTADPQLEQEPAVRTIPAAASSNDAPAVHHKPKLSWTFNPFEGEKAVKPISYTPLPGIAIFPVIKHGNDKAFGDLPLIFAREYAQRMELKVPETKIYHPIYTVDELKAQGLGHLYKQIMSYYLKAGRPEPMAMDYLLKQMNTNGHSISRVIFVEADLDTFHPDAATSLTERVKGLMTDGTPKQMRYFVRSRLQIFDAEKPSFPMVWGGSWSRSVKTNQFFNVTPSVFADSDSQQAFARVSREMSRELVYVTPKEAYMAPQYDTSVQGKVVSEKDQPFPNFTEAKPSQEQLSAENKQAIQRILQRQNAISP